MGYIIKPEYMSEETKEMMRHQAIEAGLKAKKAINEAPTVHCPQVNADVPIWHCIGSFTQRRKTCPYLIHAEVNNGKSAKVKCSWKKNGGSHG